MYSFEKFRVPLIVVYEYDRQTWSNENLKNDFVFCSELAIFAVYFDLEEWKPANKFYAMWRVLQWHYFYSMSKIPLHVRDFEYDICVLR